MGGFAGVATLELVTGGCGGGTGGRVMPVIGDGPDGASAGGLATGGIGGLFGREFGEATGTDGACFTDTFNEEAWEIETTGGAGGLRGTTGGGGKGAFGLSTTGCGGEGGTEGGGGMDDGGVGVDEAGNIRFGTGGTGGAGGKRGELAESFGRTGGGMGDAVVVMVVVVDDMEAATSEEGVWGGVPFGGTGRGKTWLGVSLRGLLDLLSAAGVGKVEDDEVAGEP